MCIFFAAVTQLRRAPAQKLKKKTQSPAVCVCATKLRQFQEIPKPQAVPSCWHQKKNDTAKKQVDKKKSRSHDDSRKEVDNPSQEEWNNEFAQNH